MYILIVGRFGLPLALKGLYVLKFGKFSMMEILK